MGYSVWIGAKTEQPIQFLKCYLDDGDHAAGRVTFRAGT